jgi:hypothetical protein
VSGLGTAFASQPPDEIGLILLGYIVIGILAAVLLAVRRDG